METNKNLKNIKLFPIYKLFAYDLLFYFAVQMLFLHDIKGISVANIVLLGSIYCAFQMLFQIPSTFVVDRIGYKKCILLGNILCTNAIITYMISNSLGIIIIGDFQMALGFALKSASETPFLFTTMKKEHIENKIAKVEAKGSSLYFYTEAVASILAGYLYIINPYIPIILCAACMLTATILSIYFDDSNITNENSEKISKSDYISDMKSGFKFILHSERLKSLLVFGAIMAGTVAIAGSFSKAFLTDIGVSSIIFGVITSALNIISAIGSSYQEKFENKRKRKTLSHIAITYTFVFFIIGIAHMIGFNNSILINVGFLVFALQNFFKGGYRVLMKKYLNNFTTTSIRSKIISVYYLCEMIGNFVLLFLASNLLQITNIGIAYIIFGSFLLILLLLVLDYMRTRLGLNPEQYKDKDINYKSAKE